MKSRNTARRLPESKQRQYFPARGVIKFRNKHNPASERNSMQKQKVIFFMAAVLLTAASSYSSPPEILTWEDCVEEAIEKNPEILLSDERLLQAEMEYGITRSRIFPSISAEAGWRDTRDREDSYSYGIIARQLIFDGFKTRYDILESEARISSSDISGERISAEVRFRLKRAFIELLRAQRQVVTDKEIVERRKQNAALVELRYEAGREHRGALMTALAQLSEAEFNLNSSLRSITTASDRLLQELGREKSAQVSAAGELTISDINKDRHPDFELITENTPVLRELAARHTAADFRMKSTRSDYLPEVRLTAGAERREEEFPPGETSWSVGLSVAVPIFDGGLRSSRLRRDKSALDEIELEIRSARNEKMTSLKNAWNELVDAVQFMEVREQFLEATRERARIAEAEYSAGLLSFDNWIVIEDELVQAENSYIRARAEAMFSEAAWIREIGGGLEDEN